MEGHAGKACDSDERLITAQEEERSRLARELHDDLTQRMAAVAIDAGRLERLISGSDGTPKALLERVRQQMAELSRDVHGLSRRLHPSVLDDLGLAAAIESENRAFFERGGAPVEFSSEGSFDTLPRSRQLALYRIVQEALRNVSKHSGADEVRMALSSDGQTVRLSVSDNGRGFDRESPDTHRGIGLASMAELSGCWADNSKFDPHRGRGPGSSFPSPREQNMKKPSILLADDHKIILDGLRGVLEESFHVLASVTNGRDLVSEANRLQPDVIVADISMPLLNGIEAVRQLRESGCASKVVFLTMHPDPTYATRALQAGGSGYVLKHSAADELVVAIGEVLRGRTSISPELRNPAMTELLGETKRHVKETLELTGRQREVLQLLAEGKSAKEIGAILEISARTVEAHKYG